METILDGVNFVASRRQFLKASIVVGGVIASTQLLGKETLLRAISPSEAKQLQQQAGEATSVFENLSMCGGLMGGSPCVADVMNGRIVRIRPIHFSWLYSPSSFGAPWTVSAPNGETFTCPDKSLPAYFAYAYKERIYGPTRVGYPMMRADFDYTKPPSQRTPQNRGVSGFVRISWDEAITIMKSELTRLSTTYGPASIGVYDDYHGETGKTIHPHPGAPYTFLTNALGGCTISCRNPDSWEGYYWGTKHFWGDGTVGMESPQQNELYDFMQNGTLGIVIGDPETTPNGHTPAGMASLASYWLKQAGKKMVYITPELNYAGAVHADKWIPVLPCTDSAWQCALAYIWITEGTYDKDFIAKHTEGFDEASLALGLPPGTSFKNYILGIVDGVPKTPEWAAPICGISARMIKALAKSWASNTTSTFHSNGGATIRGPYCHEPGRLLAYLLAMQGIGKPGVHQIKMHEMNCLGYGWWFANPSIQPSTAAGSRGIGPNFANVPFFAKCWMPEVIAGKSVSYYGSGGAGAPVQDQFTKYSYPWEGFSPIKALWSGTPCFSACLNDGNAMVQALRGPGLEFYVTQSIELENDSLFADLVLPVTTGFENDIDISCDSDNAQYAILYLRKQAIAPIGESKSDSDICEALGVAMGYDFTLGKTHEEWVKLAFASSGVPSTFTWDDFVQNQYYVFPPMDNWQSLAPGFAFLRTAGNTLNTKSGAMEFVSQWLYQHFPNDTDRPPRAHYIAEGATHQESLSSLRAQKYPILVESNHPRWREHVNMDGNEWLREIWSHKMKGPDGYGYQPMWIHPTTAAARGIKYGDIVKIYNERGAVLAAAAVTQRMIPGAISIDHGARLDPLELHAATSTLNEMGGTDGVILDRGGEINLICPYPVSSPNAGGMVVSGYLVEVEKVDLAALAAKYPAAFARYQDPNFGLTTSSWATGTPVEG